MIVYISGPMTGIKNDNAKAFNRAERDIKRAFRDQMYLEVINPIKIARKVRNSFKELNEILARPDPSYKKTVPSWSDYMRMDIVYLCQCTHILFLERYQDSKGAIMEMYIAKKLNIRCAETIEELKESGVYDDS
jgi:hypothetical protein